MEHYAPAGDQHETAYAVAATADGDAVVVGRANQGANLDDIIVMRLDSVDGDTQWLVHIDGMGFNDRAYDVVVNSDGDVALTAVSVNPDDSADYMTCLLNGDDGHTSWTRREPGAINNENIAGWLALTGDDDIIMASRTWISGHSFDVVLHRYAAANGALMWEETYDNGGVADDIRDMILDEEGNIIVAGVSDGDMMTLRYAAADGQFLWSAFKDGPMGWYDLANCAMQGPGGEIVVAGFTDSGTSTWDATLVSYDLVDGSESWSIAWDGADGLTDELKGLALSDDGDLYTIGYSYANGTDMDLVALCYEYTATGVPGVWNGAQPLAAWPNPFRERTTLSFSLGAAGEYRAEIYDAQGRLVRELASGQAPAGATPLTWDGRDDAGRPTPAGVYLARVRGEAGEQHGRLLRLR